MLLEGKTAVVTGALSGIGRTTLERFAAEGADVFACCIEKSEEFESAVAALSAKYGREIIPVYFDFEDDEQIKQAIKEINSYKKSISVLANIAGVSFDALFQMASMPDIKRTMSINFFQQMFFTQYIVKLMLRAGGGSIVNVSSIVALDGNAGQLAYGASKAAVASATKTLSKELAPKNIRVNAVAPGVINTGMTANVPKELTEEKIERTDLGRIGEPDEVASVIAYLASDSASYITGQIIRICGGIG